MSKYNRLPQAGRKDKVNGRGATAGVKRQSGAATLRYVEALRVSVEAFSEGYDFGSGKGGRNRGLKQASVATSGSQDERAASDGEGRPNDTSSWGWAGVTTIELESKEEHEGDSLR